jgi:hypothetical protein
MFKPLDEFAGWLKFFQVIIFMNLVFNGVSSFTLIEALIKAPEKIVTLGQIFQLGVILFIFYSILKIIQYRDSFIPEKIKEYLFYIFILAIVHFVFYIAVTILVYKNEWTQTNTLSLFGANANMIWAAFWRTYFEKSKRVNAYYTQNIDLVV